MPSRSVFFYDNWPLIPRLPEKADETKRHIAANIQQVTEENEKYIRSYHSAFEDAEFVCVYCNPSSLRESVWMVHPAYARRNAFLLDNLSVAGRGVHVMAYNPPPTDTQDELSGYYRHIEDPLEDLNPRVSLSDSDISLLRKYWPNIVGVRVYVCGVISLLVHHWDDALEVTAPRWSTSIGGLRTQIESFQNIEPSSIDRMALPENEHTGATKQTGLRI
ncbi:uncharacterized protein EV420DRAFT_1646481 [Desarmillaria tabescens]|uniref:Uncharacterized protein n=1 Tax=Armillaria tabescens TaxID=1929756 RepID=A0AA39JX55_ARMTA|nr:uncharacterized protein EV420DRAFT_1646481 [Desarmillaria tabescens]KAK0450561.1 hypothetical protein EV420DRAFT_1646481 [Desarmillaria tabescens]